MATYISDKHRLIPFKMINFGAPRVGNGDFKSWTEAELTNMSAWRYVYRKDAVPRMMSRHWGYRHAGHLVAINRRNSKAYYRQSGLEGTDYSTAPTSWYGEFWIYVLFCFTLFFRLMVLYHISRVELVATSTNHHKSSAYLNHFKRKIDNEIYWPVDFERESDGEPGCPWYNPLCNLF